MEELGIYIHIPFCKQKCFYCDFCSFANKNEMQGKYVETVINEIKNITHKEKYTVTTIYLGGGTPSILNPDYIKNILQEIKSSFEILDDAEITIEINPGTVNEEKLKIIINKDLRVNKLNERILISAMSVYNSPDTTYQLDLFNRDKIGYLTIPFEEKNYSKYLDELAECKLTIRGYSKNLINSFNKLAKFVYPINGKKRK